MPYPLFLPLSTLPDFCFALYLGWFKVYLSQNEGFLFVAVFKGSF